MSLFGSTHHHHSHDNSVHVRFPETIKVHEHKAPTDESIRLMEEMHNKAMSNIIAKVKVDGDNIVSGMAYLIEQPWMMDSMKIICKFKINGQEFTIEKPINREELITQTGAPYIAHATQVLHSHAKAVMVWWVLKKLQAILFEQITGTKPPEELYF